DARLFLDRPRRVSARRRRRDGGPVAAAGRDRRAPLLPRLLRSDRHRRFRRRGDHRAQARPFRRGRRPVLVGRSLRAASGARRRHVALHGVARGNSAHRRLHGEAHRLPRRRVRRAGPSRRPRRPHQRRRPLLLPARRRLRVHDADHQTRRRDGRAPGGRGSRAHRLRGTGRLDGRAARCVRLRRTERGGGLLALTGASPASSLRTAPRALGTLPGGMPAGCCDTRESWTNRSRALVCAAVAHTADFSETHFADLVQFYCQRREQVAVRFRGPEGDEGVVYIGDGQLLAANLGERHGVDAVRVALELKQGTFRVERNIPAPERNIFAPWTQVLLEAAIHVDESALMPTPAGIRPSVTPPPARPTSSTSLRPPPRATNAPSPRPPPPPPRRSPVIPIVAGLVVLAVAAAGFFWYRGREDTAPVAPASAAVQQPLPDLNFGISAALTGPAKELGRAMKTGIEVAF